jgi:hypothetical protein
VHASATAIRSIITVTARLFCSHSGRNADAGRGSERRVASLQVRLARACVRVVWVKSPGTRQIAGNARAEFSGTVVRLLVS